MKKITEAQAKLIAKGLTTYLSEHHAAEGMDMLKNTNRLAMLLRNVSDDISLAAPDMDEEAAKNEVRNQQWESAQEVLRAWMNRVYEDAPNINDGEYMRIVFEGGSWGSHHKHDFQMFSFTATVKEQVGDF